MSKANVELIRESWDAWTRGDVEGVLAFYAPDVEWVTTEFRDWPERGYTGHAGVRRFLGEWLDIWDAFEAGVEEIFAAPDGRVVALAWQRGKGRYSGLAMDMEWAQIFTFRDGKIIRVDNYEDRTRALEAAGLKLRGMSQQNVEIVRAGFEAWNAGDTDAFRELFDPDVIMRNPEGWPEPGPFVGREAVMRQWEQQREIWAADTLEPISDPIGAADRVVVRFIWRGAGRGPEANMELTGVYTVRKGRVFAVEFFWDYAEALETLGLRE